MKTTSRCAGSSARATLAGKCRNAHPCQDRSERVLSRIAALAVFFIFTLMINRDAEEDGAAEASAASAAAGIRDVASRTSYFSINMRSAAMIPAQLMRMPFGIAVFVSRRMDSPF